MERPAPDALDPPRRTWTFLTNHALVLVSLALDPTARQRDIADAVGITPAAVQRILDELERSGYVRRERVGRRNRYEVLVHLPLRHRLEANGTVASVLAALAA
jgi:DNA-binding MarR family transcriptional regulator